MSAPDKLKVHLFICTNQKKMGECCGKKGGGELRDLVKKMCREKGMGLDVRINASGCLGHCEKGITAVMYPQAQWMYHLGIEDSQKLVEWVEKTRSEEIEIQGIQDKSVE